MDHPETAAVIEKDIQELNSLHRFDKFINLSAYYRLNRSENGAKCSNCNFFVNVWYIYIENLVGGNKIDTLQNYCQEHFGNYFSLRTILKSLAPVEREKRKLEQKFAEVLKIWNCTKIALPEEEKNKFCYIFL